MASTIDRDRKVTERQILEVARKLFTENGYESSSMSRMAEGAGVAPNTIYWYFKDKDALLIAVLDELLARAQPELALRSASPLDEQLAWLVDVLDDSRNLIATVHARTVASDAVRAWHSNFHRMTELTLLAWLKAYGVPKRDLAYAAQITMFVIEGLLAHPSSVGDRSALIGWLVASLGRASRSR